MVWFWFWFWFWFSFGVVAPFEVEPEYKLFIRLFGILLFSILHYLTYFLVLSYEIVLTITSLPLPASSLLYQNETSMSSLRDRMLSKKPENCHTRVVLSPSREF